MYHQKIIDELNRSGPVSIISLFELLVSQAGFENASDIHIDPTEHILRIRFRIDGLLYEKYEIKKILHSEILCRIKVLARLRTDLHQTPQDGRFRLELSGNVLDVRVSIIPTFYGENAVLRLLKSTLSTASLDDLGIHPPEQEKIKRALSRMSGMILATGPTGSGKTTTLYTLIKMLNVPGRSIVTIEDPIEYALPGIRQIQTNEHGLSFANGLRSILRQDPNIIMVGEIRDSETARIAVNAALTGHLILSTLHTNDATSSVLRLIDMGIDAYLVASTVKLIISQRLVRKFCPHCKKTGCPACAETGFKGRTGMYEILAVEANIRTAIQSNLSSDALQSLARSSGMRSMQEDGLMKADAGLLSKEEVIAAAYE